MITEVERHGAWTDPALTERAVKISPLPLQTMLAFCIVFFLFPFFRCLLSLQRFDIHLSLCNFHAERDRKPTVHGRGRLKKASEEGRWEQRSAVM